MIKVSSIVVVAFLLSACGGGGSSPGGQPSPSEPTSPAEESSTAAENDTAFSESPLAVNVPTSKIINACNGDGVQQQFLLPVDLNHDEFIDFIAHYWCLRNDPFIFDDGPTPDLLVAYVSNDEGVYEEDNLTYFGVSDPKLGGASRNVDSGDLNGDAKPDFAFAVNREDLRSTADLSTVVAKPAVLLSNSIGYDVQSLGTAIWGHSVAINGNMVVFPGFGNGPQVFRFNDGAFVDLTDDNAINYDTGAFDIYNDYVVQGVTKSIGDVSFTGVEVLSSNGSVLDDFLYEEVFKINRQEFGGGGYQERSVYSKDNGDLFFDPLANQVTIFESNRDILVAVLFDTFIYAGDGDLFENKSVDQDQIEGKKEVLLFSLEDNRLISKSDDLEHEFENDFIQFSTISDINEDGYPDIQFSVLDQSQQNQNQNVDGVPKIFLNDGTNRFIYVGEDNFDPEYLSTDTSARGFVYDVNGDGIPDFVRFTVISALQDVKIEIFLGETKFYE